jgi:hypothetical protein
LDKRGRIDVLLSVKTKFSGFTNCVLWWSEADLFIALIQGDFFEIDKTGKKVNPIVWPIVGSTIEKFMCSEVRDCRGGILEVKVRNSCYEIAHGEVIKGTKSCSSSNYADRFLMPGEHAYCRNIKVLPPLFFDSFKANKLRRFVSIGEQSYSVSNFEKVGYSEVSCFGALDNVCIDGRVWFKNALESSSGKILGIITDIHEYYGIMVGLADNKIIVGDTVYTVALGSAASRVSLEGVTVFDKYLILYGEETLDDLYRPYLSMMNMYL